MQKYATKDQLMGVDGKIEDILPRQEFEILKSEFYDTKKNLNTFMTKDEVVKRFNHLNDSITKKLDDKTNLEDFQEKNENTK